MTHTTKFPEQIQADALRSMLFDPDIPDEELAGYMLLDESDSRSFAPVVRVNPSLIQPPPAGSGLGSALQGALAIGGLNGISKWRRKQRYERRISGGWTGLKLVSEGDSWFQFPFLLEDTIDHLSKKHAILSLGGAGDTLDDILRQDEIVAAVLAEDPDAVLLSGGGNDLLGGGRLANVVKSFTPGEGAEEHITPAYDTTLATVIGHVRTVATRIAVAAPGTPMLIHTYDHAIPDNGRWLGRPLASKGITNTGLQREIIEIMIDRWANALDALAAEPALSGKLTIVDCRNVVADDGWNDELHPDSVNYGKVADIFEAAIQTVTAAPRPARALSAFGRPSASTTPAPTLGDAVEEMSALYSEQVLIAEIGRRASLERATPAGAMRALSPTPVSAVASSSLAGGYATFRQLGARILARAHRELHGLLCGEDAADKEDRQALRDAFNIGTGALATTIAGLLASGPLGLSAFVAAPVAALIVRRFLAPSWEETCTLWGEKLDAGGSAQQALTNAHQGVQRRPNANRFCVALKKPQSEAEAKQLGKTRAAVHAASKWPFNASITIRFLEGSDFLKEKVTHFAKLWVADDMAALTFKFVESGDAQIRVSFIQGNGSWSLLGTDCLNETDQTKPTMNFGWLTDTSSDDEIREVVLHEFGHALGLIHEHQNPEGGIVWDEQAVLDDLSGAPNFWNEDTIRHNVLNHYDPNALEATDTDPLSIMMYPIPNTWTVGDFETGMNTDFSPTDRELIRAAYPAI
ncbi:MAG: GDSL-type esterase/lipase family protein [Pseudomonadota bacterium]